MHQKMLSARYATALLICFVAEIDAFILDWRWPNVLPVFLLAVVLLNVAILVPFFGVCLPLWRELRGHRQPHDGERSL